MDSAATPRVFEAENFATMKEWIYFCVEFDLEVCPGCSCRSRRRAKDADSSQYTPTWFCDGCEPPVHPDLAKVLQGGQSADTRCDLCGKSVPVQDCWISDDCRRLYCATHLEPIQVEDRYRMARQYLQRWYGSRQRLTEPEPQRQALTARSGSRVDAPTSRQATRGSRSRR